MMGLLGGSRHPLLSNNHFCSTRAVVFLTISGPPRLWFHSKVNEMIEGMPATPQTTPDTLRRNSLLTQAPTALTPLLAKGQLAY